MPTATTKTTPSAKDRRKSDKPPAAPEPTFESDRPGLVTLTVASEKLRAILDPSSVAAPVKEETPVKDKESPATSTTLPAAPASNPDAPSDSTPNTPNPSGTPAPPSVMGPPTEGPKKKGVKRSAAAANGNGSDGPTAKIRGKPGPKKKARLDDGTLESGRANGLGHKLGPKANQGAINAGLRALDRSGKPCRKWSKGGFTLKSFTGVVWSIPRWTAPQRSQPDAEGVVPSPPQESATASAEGSGSNKENGNAVATNGVSDIAEKSNGTSNETAQVKDEVSNGAVDVEMQSAPSVNGDSPAPVPIAAAS